MVSLHHHKPKARGGMNELEQTGLILSECNLDYPSPGIKMGEAPHAP